MFENIKSLFQKPDEGPQIITVSGGANPNELPQGFFESLGGDTKSVGFNCRKCKFTVKYGAGRIVQHCGIRETRPDGPLPQVRWAYGGGKQSGGVQTIGGVNLLDTSSLDTFDGEYEWTGDKPRFGV